MEERTLRAGIFKDQMLRKLFGLVGDGVMGGWRKFLNEELHNLFCSVNIIRLIK
jgi:hypothetical protein